MGIFIDGEKKKSYQKKQKEFYFCESTKDEDSRDYLIEIFSKNLKKKTLFFMSITLFPELKKKKKKKKTSQIYQNKYEKEPIIEVRF